MYFVERMDILTDLFCYNHCISCSYTGISKSSVVEFIWSNKCVFAVFNWVQ